jgi:hypothetical protein
MFAATISVILIPFTSFFAKDKNYKSVKVKSGLNVITKSIENITPARADCIYTVQVTGADKITVTSTGVSVIKRGEKFSKKFPGR